MLFRVTGKQCQHLIYLELNSVIILRVTESTRLDCLTESTFQSLLIGVPGRKSVRYRGHIVWNSIFKVIRNASSLQRFKARLKCVSRTIDLIQFEKVACLISSKDPDI